MNSIIHEYKFRHVARMIGIIVVLLLPLTTMAQDCETTAYLESQTIKAGEQITVVAGMINNQPGKQFVIEDGGVAVLQAGKRIELNYGFRALSGSLLVAQIEPCDPNNTPPTEDPVDVFPNPTDGIVNIKASYKIVALRLIDMTGFPLFEKREINDSAFSLDISEVKPGFYILEVVGEKVTDKIRIEKR